MDTIKFVVSKINFIEKGREVVNIYINDRNLIEILKEYESPFAVAEGDPGFAGRYMGLSPKEVFYPSKSFLGCDEAKTTILRCSGCDEPGCWDFDVKITVTKDKVIWNDFEQTVGGEVRNPKWKYDRLGPFTFDRKQYEKELKRL